MQSSKLRRQIAWEAARLMYSREEAEYHQAKMKAARRVCHGWVPPADLPTDSEIRNELQAFARLHEGDRGAEQTEGSRAAAPLDRFLVYESLLAPLENVKQSPKTHPEGDVLYHSLQVFDHARDEIPYDEEFLLAALLHDIGKGIDPLEHIASALEALDGYITERTAWLIEHHHQGQAILEGTIGVRARRRLEEHESYEELVLLARCDRAGRQAGVEAPELKEAIEYLRDLSQECS